MRVKRHTVAALVLGVTALLGAGVAVTAAAQDVPPAAPAAGAPTIPPNIPPAAAAPLATSAPAAVDMEAGKVALEENCAGCHGASVVENHGLSASGWHEVVDRMVGYGAVMTDEQIKTIVDYLAVTHPPK